MLKASHPQFSSAVSSSTLQKSQIHMLKIITKGRVPRDGVGITNLLLWPRNTPRHSSMEFAPGWLCGLSR